LCRGRNGEGFEQVDVGDVPRLHADGVVLEVLGVACAWDLQVLEHNGRADERLCHVTGIRVQNEGVQIGFRGEGLQPARILGRE